MNFLFILIRFSSAIFSAQVNFDIQPASLVNLGFWLSICLQEKRFEKIFNNDTVCCGFLMCYDKYYFNAVSCLIIKMDAKTLGLPADKVLIFRVFRENKFLIIPSIKLHMSPDLKKFVIDTIAQQKNLKDADVLKAKVEKISEGELAIFRPFSEIKNNI